MLAHCRAFVSEASPSVNIVCCIKVCLQPITSLSRSALYWHFTQHCFSQVKLFGFIALFSQEISDRLIFLLNRAEEIETRSEKIAFFLEMLFNAPLSLLHMKHLSLPESINSDEVPMFLVTWLDIEQPFSSGML